MNYASFVDDKTRMALGDVGTNMAVDWGKTHPLPSGGSSNPFGSWLQSAAEFAPYAGAMVGGITGLQGLGYLPAGGSASAGGAGLPSMQPGSPNAFYSGSPTDYGPNFGDGAGTLPEGGNAMQNFQDSVDVPNFTPSDAQGIGLGNGMTAYLPGAAAAGAGLGLGSITSALGSAAGLKALGALGGGLLGSGLLGGGAKQAGTVTTVQDIPDWLKPYVMKNIAGAQGVMNNPLFDPTSILQKANGIASNPLYDPTQNLQNAQNVLNAGVAPNPLVQQAQDEMSKTIAGQYLSPDSNPWLKSTYDQAAKAVSDSYLSTTQPKTDFMFGRTGNAFGDNSGYQETVARNQFGFGQNLNNLATDIYGGNYNNERNRQFSAAAGAPGFAQGAANAQQANVNAAFAPFANFAQIQGQSINNAFAPLTAQMSLQGQGINNAFAPFTQMNELFPNVRSSSQPYFQNNTANALGGALMGSQLFGR
jgi:hypothetical protein